MAREQTNPGYLFGRDTVATPSQGWQVDMESLIRLDARIRTLETLREELSKQVNSLEKSVSMYQGLTKWAAGVLVAVIISMIGGWVTINREIVEVKTTNSAIKENVQDEMREFRGMLRGLIVRP